MSVTLFFKSHVHSGGGSSAHSDKVMLDTLEGFIIVYSTVMCILVLYLYRDLLYRAVFFFFCFHTHQFGLDPTEIKAFPLFQYSKVKDLEIGRGVTLVECAICLGEFEEAETLRLLPKCNHVFHQQCIDKWLARHVTCPVCRELL